MKVIFCLDTNEFVELGPDKIQIRQLQPNVAALGTEVQVPVLEEDGKTPQKNEDGTPKTQIGFRPFINYNVNLTIPYATIEDEIVALKKQLGDKLAEQAAGKLAPPPAPPATPASQSVVQVPAPAGKQKVSKANGVAKAKRKAN